MDSLMSHLHRFEVSPKRSIMEKGIPLRLPPRGAPKDVRKMTDHPIDPQDREPPLSCQIATPHPPCRRRPDYLAAKRSVSTVDRPT